jgi:predicted nucleotidyltransferase
MLNNNLNTFHVTRYDIAEILNPLSREIKNLLGENLIGIYLFGSLAYGDFSLGSSDIDLVVITRIPIEPNKLALVKKMHHQIGERFSQWHERLECYYTPIDMLKNILPPKNPRPYYGGGIFYDEAPYGNEWIINNYLLLESSIALLGPPFKTLCSPIEITEVQKACIRDLFQEWEPKIRDDEWLDNSHYQSYLILNLCRILYTVFCKATASKKISSEWVKDQFGSPWNHLIEVAQRWQYGKTMCEKENTINFIKFVIEKIKQTDLYKTTYHNV